MLCKDNFYTLLDKPRGVTRGITSPAGKAAGLINFFSTNLESSRIDTKNFIEIGSAGEV